MTPRPKRSIRRFAPLSINAHNKALAILNHNRGLLESISEKILEKEVIEGDDLKELLASSVMP